MSEAPGASGDQPVVTVVLPMHNAEDVIAKTIHSVLNQTFQDFEIILCDDGSTDDTVARAVAAVEERSDPVAWSLLRLKGRGAAGARNDGIEVARGEFIAFLDDDDCWAPQKLEVSLGTLRDLEVDMVCHAEQWADDGPGGATHVRLYRHLFDDRLDPLISLFRNNPFSTSAIVVRRDRLVQAGLFDEEIPSAEDYDLWIRLVAISDLRFGFEDSVLGTYLVRSGGESGKVDRRYEALLCIGERYSTLLVERFGPKRAWFELWIYRARVEFTTGVRLVRQGRVRFGLRMAMLGWCRWPFRFDWVRFWLKNRKSFQTGHRHSALMDHCDETGIT